MRLGTAALLSVMLVWSFSARAAAAGEWETQLHLTVHRTATEASGASWQAAWLEVRGDFTLGPTWNVDIAAATNWPGLLRNNSGTTTDETGPAAAALGAHLAYAAIIHGLPLPVVVRPTIGIHSATNKYAGDIVHNTADISAGVHVVAPLTRNWSVAGGGENILAGWAGLQADSLRISTQTVSGYRSYAEIRFSTINWRLAAGFRYEKQLDVFADRSPQTSTGRSIYAGYCRWWEPARPGPPM